MSDNEKLYELRQLASNITLLYVEDNKRLREQAVRILERFFGEIIVADDGEQGLKIFRELRPKMVISDIQMPNMNGLDMARSIYEISPQTKIFIASAYDDRDYLLEAINIGIFRYLKKPLKISSLYNELIDGLKQLEAEENDNLFNRYKQNIFDNQNTLLILYNNRKPIIANNAFFEYFGMDDLESFINNFGSIGEHFLEQEGFLFNTEERDWFDEASDNLNRLYHVKMNKLNETSDHFIFKMIPICEKDEHFLLSMENVTELACSEPLNKSETEQSDKSEDKTYILRQLERLKRDNAEIKIVNFYKGLAIINKGSVHTVSEEKIELKSSYLQQRGAQHEKHLIIVSEIFSSDIKCDTIKNIDYHKQTIEVDDLHFVTNSPSQRKSIRLEADEKHTASLIYKDHILDDGVRVMDISLEAAKLSLFSLPVSFKEGDQVHLNLTFNMSDEQTVINTEGKVYDIRKNQKEYQVIVIFESIEKVKKSLVDYLFKRQMALIKEFKGL